jgi:hypothetical protein
MLRRMTTRITIAEQSPGRYRATLNGEGLIGGSDTPFLDSARVLLSRGVTGRLEMWDETRPYPRMVGDIASAARLTVRTDRGKLRFDLWRPLPSARGPLKQPVED